MSAERNPASSRPSVQHAAIQHQWHMYPVCGPVWTCCAKSAASGAWPRSGNYTCTLLGYRWENVYPPCGLCGTYVPTRWTSVCICTQFRDRCIQVYPVYGILCSPLPNVWTSEDICPCYGPVNTQVPNIWTTEYTGILCINMDQWVIMYPGYEPLLHMYSLCGPVSIHSLFMYWWVNMHPVYGPVIHM